MYPDQTGPVSILLGGEGLTGRFLFSVFGTTEDMLVSPFTFHL